MKLTDRENIPHFQFLLSADAILSGLVFSRKLAGYSYYYGLYIYVLPNLYMARHSI